MTTSTRPPGPTPPPGISSPRTPRPTRPTRARVRHPALRRTLLAALASMLGAVTLKGLLSDNGWLIDAWLSMVVVVLPAAVIRIWRPPGALDIWPGVVLLIPWLTGRFVPQHALLGIIPTRATLHDVSLLMDDLHRTTQQETAPIHSTTAVRLVVCALLGLLAALIDLIAVVGRRGALAGVPLLVVYTVSGAVPRRPVPWQWFALAALGFLILLAIDADDELRSWGRRIPHPGGGVRHGGGLAVSAPRVAIAALVVAVALPALVPAHSGNLIANAFHNHGNGTDGFGARDGGGGSISPFAALKGDLDQGTPRSLMNVHVVSSVDPFYLRTNILDLYTDKGWTVSDHGETQDVQTSSFGADPASGDPRSQTFDAQITVTGLGGNAPVFTSLQSINGVEAGTTWSPQDQVLLGKNVHKGEQIDETVDQPTPTAAQLEQAPPTSADNGELSRWLKVPTLPAYVDDLVQSLTGELSSPYDKARAINDYFTDGKNGFTYSLDTKVGDSGSELVDFLDGKQGYCQQYAAAEAIMLRQAGVPSRVVLGYMHMPADKNGDFTVMSTDAHAWVEVYLQGFGWIPFDPTPAAGLSGGRADDLPWAPHSGFPSGASVGAVSKPAAPTSAAPTSATAASSSATGLATPTVDTSGSSTTALLSALVVILVVVLLLVPALARFVRRRRRYAAARAGDTNALWSELSDTAVDLGYVWSPARSPRQIAAWLGAEVAGSRATLDELAAAREQQLYGRSAGAGPESSRSGSRLTHELSTITGELRAGRSFGTRVRAVLWPTSLGWTPFRRGARRH